VVNGTSLSSGAAGDLHGFSKEPVVPPMTPLQEWFAEEMQKPVSLPFTLPCSEGEDPEFCAAGQEMVSTAVMVMIPGGIFTRSASAGAASGRVAVAPRTLWHGGKVKPEVAFNQGIRPKGGPAKDLREHVRGVDSNLASTSTSRRIARDFTMKYDKYAPKGKKNSGWVYEIEDSGKGIDVNANLERKYRLAYEKEIAVEGGSGFRIEREVGLHAGLRHQPALRGAPAPTAVTCGTCCTDHRRSPAGAA
jgi:hypothetical protein